MMRTSIRRLIACLLLAAAAGVPVAAQPTTGRIVGQVTDGSGGALPGATVTVMSTAIVQPVVVVTDSAGRFTTPPLPPGVYAVQFELTGFAPQTRADVELRAGDVAILDRQLSVAAIAESVEVIGSAPPKLPPPPTFHTPPRPAPVAVPEELLASVCGPAQPGDSVSVVGKIVGHRDDKHRTLYGNGDVLVLDLGSDRGAAPGQNYVVRRQFRIGERSVPAARASYGQQTSAVVQIVEAAPNVSLAIVVYTCGELFAGDLIETFEPTPMWEARDGAAPHFEEPGRIVFGENNRLLGAPRQLMVIDRGSAQGAMRGQLVTIFRRAHGERGPVSTVAHGIVVAVRPDSATIRIERASDAVLIGDLVALHR